MQPPSSRPHSGLQYLLAFGTLILGVALGYILNMLLPTVNLKSVPQNQQPAKSVEIELPNDAVRIQSCSENRGALFVKPADIPVGPIYMVSDGKVIGLEFMLAQDEFLAGKNFSNLLGHNIKVDHVNTGLLLHGHAGYTKPHYHIDLYTVPQSVEEKITCQEGEGDMEMQGMDMGAPPATPSAVPSITAPVMQMEMTVTPTVMEMYR